MKLYIFPTTTVAWVKRDVGEEGGIFLMVRQRDRVKLCYFLTTTVAGVKRDVGRARH